MEEQVRPTATDLDEPLSVPTTGKIDVFGRLMTPAQVLGHAKQNCRVCNGRGVVIVNGNKGGMCRCVERNLQRRYGPKTDPLPEQPKEESPPTDWMARKTERLSAQVAKLQAEVDEIKHLDDEAVSGITKEIEQLSEEKTAMQALHKMRQNEAAEIGMLIAKLEEVLAMRRNDLEGAKLECAIAEAKDHQIRVKTADAEDRLRLARQPRARLLAARIAELEKVKRRLQAHGWRHGAV